MKPKTAENHQSGASKKIRVKLKFQKYVRNSKLMSTKSNYVEQTAETQ